MEKIIYYNEEEELSEKNEAKELSESVSTLKEISQELSKLLKNNSEQIKEADKNIDSTKDEVIETNIILLKTKKNNKLKMALMTSCGVLGASLFGFPLISLIGSYSLITATCGGICGGFIGSKVY